MYKPGDLKILGRHQRRIYDSSTFEFYSKTEGAYLEHRCEEWYIGGPEQIRALIADLQRALETMAG